MRTSTSISLKARHLLKAIPTVFLEAKENQDIIQENYVESYWNLTRKTVGQLKWTKEYCPGAKILAHLDDDVFIDVPKVIKALTVDQVKDYKAFF